MEERTDWPAIGCRQSPVGRRAGPRSQTVSSGSRNLPAPSHQSPTSSEQRLARSCGGAGAHDGRARRALQLTHANSPVCPWAHADSKILRWGLGVWEWEVTQRTARWTGGRGYRLGTVANPCCRKACRKQHRLKRGGRGSVRTSCRAGGAQWGAADDSTTRASPYLGGVVPGSDPVQDWC